MENFLDFSFSKIRDLTFVNLSTDTLVLPNNLFYGCKTITEIRIGTQLIFKNKVLDLDNSTVNEVGNYDFANPKIGKLIFHLVFF